MDQLQTVETEVGGQRALFDYGALDQDTQVLVRLRAGEIKSLAKRVAGDIVEIGGKLAEVKDRIGGNFNDWLSAEMGWSERTAYNFIAVWQKFSSANFALENVATSALYLLAAPSTPPEAVEVAKQIAESGEQVTHGVAKEIVRQAKERKPKQTELIEEPEEEETGGDVSGAVVTDTPEPVRVYVEQNELEEMHRFDSEAEIDRGEPVQIVHRPPYGADDSFVITESLVNQYGVVFATGWRVKPEREAGGVRQRNHPADLVDEVPEYAESYLGVRVNAGSKESPEWWVVVGPAYEFKLDPLPSGWKLDRMRKSLAGGYRAIHAERSLQTPVLPTYGEMVAAARSLDGAPAPISAPAPTAKSAQRAESAQKRLAVEASSAPADKRPAAWYKTRVEIVITLMSGGDAETRKVMHSVRAGDSAQDIPFVAVSSGEAELLDVLPPITRGLVEKAAEAFAKKQAAKPAAKKPTTKSKPVAKKPAAKSKAKGGKK